MSYLVCENCGKNYELNEGKSSFNYDKCECGGKLTYVNSLNKNKILKSYPSLEKVCSNCGAKIPRGSNECYNCANKFTDETQGIRGVSWLGVAVGFGFLMTTIMIIGLAYFGTNIPQRPEDFPTKFIMVLIVTIPVMTVISGMISSYIGGSVKMKDGIINGGLVGVVLGIVAGVTSGSIAFLDVIAIFGSLSVLGGIFGTLLKRRL